LESFINTLAFVFRDRAAFLSSLFVDAFSRDELREDDRMTVLQ
jgi:hypothetical protein